MLESGQIPKELLIFRLHWNPAPATGEVASKSENEQVKGKGFFSVLLCRLLLEAIAQILEGSSHLK